VIELPSVLRIVGNRFGPSPLLDEQIEVLRRAVESGVAEPHRYLNVGSRVQIVRGPLSGAQGVLLRKKGCLKVVLSVETIMQSVAVELNSCDVEPCISARLVS
jgi:transcription antitermination factor NusG